MAIRAEKPVTHTNVMLVQRFFDELVNGGNADVAEELLAEDYVRHDPATPEGQYGPAEFVRFVEGVRASFPDMEVTVDEIFAADDRVVVRATERGTHEGPFAGLEPTGESFEIDGIVIHRCEGGKIAETWACWDRLGMMRQLDAIPSNSRAASERS